MMEVELPVISGAVKSMKTDVSAAEHRRGLWEMPPEKNNRVSSVYPSAFSRPKTKFLSKNRFSSANPVFL
ncbi:MAG: hypothetical protein HFI65_06900 [Lachnospiraceae bacterium]|nr:hypothetical protein [Lachnospiraceae bacterium]